MRKAGPLFQIAFALLGLLTIAAFILTVKPSERAVDGLPTSYSNTGTRAFVELLTQEGMNVAVDRSAAPRLRADTLAISLRWNRDLWDDNETTPSKQKKTDRIEDFVRSGGKELRLSFPKNLVEAPPTSLTSFPGLPSRKLLLTTSKESMHSAKTPNGIGQLANEQVAATLRHLGSGIVLTPTDGSIALNQLIGQADNAKFLLHLVRSLTGPNKQVVILTTTLGDDSGQGMFELIGPWASAMKQQVLFILFVAVIALGFRFGDPITQGLKSQTSLGFIEAVAGLMERTQGGQQALLVAIERSERTIKSALKLGREAPLADYQEQIEEQTWSRLSESKNLANQKAHARDYLKAAVDLDKAVRSAYPSRKAMGRGRRSATQ